MAPIAEMRSSDHCFEEPTVDSEFYFQWHLTERCNRRCRHCYHTSYDSAGELSDDEAHQVAHRIQDALRVWRRRGAISLTGGEPWLRRDLVLALLDELAAGDVVDRVDLLTNGELLDDSDCAALASRTVLRRVQVSIEGATVASHDAIRGAGSFRLTLAAVSRLKRHGITVAAMMTLSRHNAREWDATFGMLGDAGVDVVSIDRFIPEGRGEDRRDWLLEPPQLRSVFRGIHDWALAHDKPRVLMYRPLFCLVGQSTPHVGAMCSVGANALTILHDGTIYPCRRLPMPIGHILRDSLHDVWYASPVLWQARVPSNLKGRCAGCELVPVCRGCRAMARAVTGDWLAEDPQCWKTNSALSS